MSSKEGINTTNKYILYFLIYSFIGWLLETIYAFIVLGHFDNRGFLLGPYCPIYGFGMLILTVGLSKYKNNKLKLFFVAAIVLTYFEYVAGFALDAIFGLKWWDYSNDFLNINGRVCLSFGIVWGFIAIIVVDFIHPFTEKVLDKLLKKINPTMLEILLKVAGILFIIDIILSTLSYIK
mgnify:CR=1 FL=1